jgi:hypothetical protein
VYVAPHVEVMLSTSIQELCQKLPGVRDVQQSTLPSASATYGILIWRPLGSCSCAVDCVLSGLPSPIRMMPRFGIAEAVSSSSPAGIFANACVSHCIVGQTYKMLSQALPSPTAASCQ